MFQILKSMCTTESDLNFLMMEALSTLPVMHEYFVLEKWRQAVFKNESSQMNKFNKLYWDLRLASIILKINTSSLFSPHSFNMALQAT